MYSKLYYIIYFYLKAKKNDDPQFNTSLIVFIAQGLHFFLLVTIIKFFIGIELISRYSNDSAINRLAFFPIGIIWLILVYYFFKNRIVKMTEKYNSTVFTNVEFIILIIVVIILPLYGVIKISGGDVWQ